MSDYNAISRQDPTGHQRGADKLSRIPIKVQRQEHIQRKPKWIRMKGSAGPRVQSIKRIMREHGLHSVCEEAQCPNLNECFSHGTATFMILGDICTRRCPFCDVAHGKPNAPDLDEPKKMANSIRLMGLDYVVITSVDRDDLRDGGAGHFADCIRAAREAVPHLKVEILVPDFRGRMDVAIEAMQREPADVFNHNLETVPRLYKQCRPGSSYEWSLTLLAKHRAALPTVATKSGLMLGLGETQEEVIEVMRDLRAHGVEMLTLGQYLQPSRDHLAVERFWTPEEFDELRVIGEQMGFSHVASGPMVRSSFHADQQAKNIVN